jgi:hypothetical protein
MSFMTNDSIEIKDLEAFIDGLKNSFDRLGDASLSESQGFQAQLAKAISALRVKKAAKFEPLPDFNKPTSKDDIKNFLLTQLELTKSLIESGESSKRRRFELALEIVKLREKINDL